MSLVRNVRQAVFALLIAYPLMAASMAQAAHVPKGQSSQYAHVAPLRGFELHWSRIAIAGATPTSVFRALGLTHMTRLGYTRDGAHKGTPDPNFPPGLTDVVPYDGDHVMLVCGTVVGLAQFRSRIEATVASLRLLRWHVEAELISGSDPVGDPADRDLASGTPVVVALGDASNSRMCEITVQARADGAVALTCREAITLDQSAAVGPVFAPSMAWNAPVTQIVALGTTVTLPCETDPADASATNAPPAAIKLTVTPYDAQAFQSPEQDTPAPAAPPTPPAAVIPSAPADPNSQPGAVDDESLPSAPQ